MENTLKLYKWEKEIYINEIQKEFSSRGMLRDTGYFERSYKEILQGI
ncbi:MAG: hypothetical protein ACO1OT_12530 [Heyndrickxia sp.]